MIAHPIESQRQEQPCVVEQHRDPPVFERVDTTILTLLDRVLSRKEFELVARILHHAEVKQYGLPGQGPATAQILVPSLTIFAQQIGYGKDTLLRHLAVYRALGLLIQRRADHQTLLSFPLAPYEPYPETTLPALDLLIRTGRPKLKQLAQSVKERYQLHYATTAMNATPSGTTVLGPELATLFLDIQQTLGARRITTTKRQVLQRQIAQVLLQLHKTGRPELEQGDRRIAAVPHPPKETRPEQAHEGDQRHWGSEHGKTQGAQGEGDRQQERGDQRVSRSKKQGDVGTQKGDRPAWLYDADEDLQTDQGDRNPLSACRRADQWMQEGDQLAPHPLLTGDFVHQKEDRAPLMVSGNGNHCAHEGDQDGRVIATTKDFSCEEGDWHLSHPSNKGDFVQEEGDRAPLMVSGNGNHCAHERDFLNEKGDQDGRVIATTKDFSQEEGDWHLSHPSNTGDFVHQQGDRNHHDEGNGSQTEDFQPQEGDFSTQNLPLSINDIGYNNLLYISSQKKDDTFIDRPVAQETDEPKRETALSGPEKQIGALQREATALALFLDKTTANVASCVKKLKENRMAVRASVIDVLYHEHCPDYRGVPKKRGAWFNTAYTRYSQPHAVIPAEIARWLHRTISWTDIEDALMQEKRKAARDDVSSSAFTETTEDHPVGISDSHSHDFCGLSDEGDCQPLVERREDHRTDEQRTARQKAARNIRQRLRSSGMVVLGRDGRDGLAIDREHGCGCPLYREKGLRRQCAHCTPDGSWGQEVRALIASILEA